MNLAAKTEPAPVLRLVGPIDEPSEERTEALTWLLRASVWQCRLEELRAAVTSENARPS